MGYVASLELCKSLYEVSGWDDTENNHYQPLKGDGNGDFKRDWVPAYDLGYLLRKLSDFLKQQDFDYLNIFMRKLLWDTSPEDAAARLAIELFKQKILIKEKN